MLALEPRMVFDGALGVTDPSQTLFDRAEDPTTTATDTPPAEPIALALADGPTTVPVARHELVVVDGGLAQLQTLLEDIRVADPNRTIVVLDPSGDEISQLTQYLQQHAGQFDALHLMTHGGKGWIDFAGQAVSLSDPAQNANLWAGISNGLRAGGDLLLYGCNVAETSAMADMVRSLSLQLGVGIAASTDPTGMSGNWSLEFQTGSIEATPLAAPHWQDDLTVALAVSSLSVNEASPYAVFFIKGNANQAVSLSLSGTATGGGVDYGSTLEWTTNGTTWTPYTSGTINLSAGDGEAFVRLPIINDTPSDNGETIILTVTPTTGTAATGVATIRDDGTGNTYSGSLTEPPLDASTLSPDGWHDLNFTKSRLMIASFHGAFYKASTGGYYVAGELASPTSTNLTTPKLVTPAEGYTYTGDIIDVVVAGSNAISQYAVLTTEGLWVWGSKNTMMPTALTPSSFSKVTLPADFSPRDALSITAADGGLAILMRDGTVRTVVIDTRASGHTNGDNFAKVQLSSATGPVLSGITDLEYGSNLAFAYSRGLLVFSAISDGTQS